MENVKNDAICHVHVTRQNQNNPAGGGATIIGNSIVKNLNGFRYNDMQAYPGLRAGTLLTKLQIPDEIKLDYDIVVVAVGTNDFENSTIQPENFVQLTY